MTSHAVYVVLNDIRAILVSIGFALLVLGVMIVHYLDGIRNELRDAAKIKRMTDQEDSP
jgi:hypothetical protein